MTISIQFLKDIVKLAEDNLLRNSEVFDKAEEKRTYDTLTTANELLEQANLLPLAKLKRYEHTLDEDYSPGGDKTFIVKHIYDVTEESNDCDKILVSTECVGWYYGEPNGEYTSYYSNGKLTATYTK